MSSVKCYVIHQIIVNRYGRRLISCDLTLILRVTFSSNNPKLIIRGQLPKLRVGRVYQVERNSDGHHNEKTILYNSFDYNEIVICGILPTLSRTKSKS